MPSDNVTFFITISKQNVILKRLTLVKSSLSFAGHAPADIVLKSTKQKHFLNGILFWKSKTSLAFYDRNTGLSKEVNASQSSNDRNYYKAVFSHLEGDITINVAAMLNGSPPKVILPCKTMPTSSIKARRPIVATGALALMIGIASFFLFNKTEPPKVIEMPKKVVQVKAIKKAKKPTLNKALFYQVLKKNKRHIEKCQYLHDFKQGSVKYKVHLKHSGKVSKVTLLADDVRSPEIIECVSKNVSQWKFPATGLADQTLFFTIALTKE